jgi:1,3-beta-glucan synthase
MLIVFIALIVGPLVAGKYIKGFSIPANLSQPTGLNRNDTLSSETGTALQGGAAATGSAAVSSSAGARKLFVRNSSW